jgi:hypothetical protein
LLGVAVFLINKTVNLTISDEVVAKANDLEGDANEGFYLLLIILDAQ